MNKFELLQLLIITLVLGLLAADVVMMLAGRHESLPNEHKQLLLTGSLLWFITLFFNKNSDDDWAGQW